MPKAGFRALSFLDTFVQGHKGCSQLVYLRQYRPLVLPVVEYAALVWVAAVTEGCKDLEKSKRVPR